MADDLKCNDIYCCKKCHLFIPTYSTEVHKKSCNDSQIFDHSHPFIEGKKMMKAKINVIADPEVSSKSIQNHSKSQSFIEATEPSYKKYLDATKNLKFVYMNYIDMCLCQIQSFTPVIVKTSNESRIFVGAHSDSVARCHVHLYNSDVKELNLQPGFITVEKINDIRRAKFIRLEPKWPKSLDYLMYEKYFSLVYKSHSLNNPLLLTLNQEVMLEYCFSPEEFVVTEIIENENPVHSLADDFAECTLNQSDKSLVTIELDEWRENDNSSSSATSISVGGDLTIFESSPQKTSTPCSKLKSSRNKKKKNSNLEEQSSKDESLCRDNQLTYFVVDRHCKVNIENPNCHSFSIPKEQSSNFFRNETFHTLFKLIETKKKCSSDDIRNQWTGLLVSGFTGIGKTEAVNQLGLECELPVVRYSIIDYAQSSLSEADYIDSCYARAKNQSPSILFFDDVLCKDNSLSSICKVLKESKSSSVICIAASNKPEDIPDRMFQNGRFDKEIIFNLPDNNMKMFFLQTFISSFNCKISTLELNPVVEMTRGFTPADFLSLDNNINMKYTHKSQSLSVEDLKKMVSSITPVFLKDNSANISPVLWKDIWGYETVKKRISEILKSSKLRSILLYGPPGCSKTMIARAITTQTKYTFLPVSSSNLLSKYAGGTEKAISNVFRKAFMCAPSLIFIDELDNLCTERDGQGLGIVSELLSWMVKTSHEGKVLIVGATNRPDTLDAALLSPGCFEVILHVDLPDFKSRCAIWEGLLDGRPQKGIDVEALAKITADYSGAELHEVYQLAGSAIDDYLIEKHDTNPQLKLELKEVFDMPVEAQVDYLSENNLDGGYLTLEHLEDALKTIKPRTTPNQLYSIKKFQDRNKVSVG